MIYINRTPVFASCAALVINHPVYYRDKHPEMVQWGAASRHTAKTMLRNHR